METKKRGKKLIQGCVHFSIFYSLFFFLTIIEPRKEKNKKILSEKQKKKKKTRMKEIDDIFISLFNFH